MPHTRGTRAPTIARVPRADVSVVVVLVVAVVTVVVVVVVAVVVALPLPPPRPLLQLPMLIETAAATTSCVARGFRARVGRVARVPRGFCASSIAHTTHRNCFGVWIRGG